MALNQPNIGHPSYAINAALSHTIKPLEGGTQTPRKNTPGIGKFIAAFTLRQKMSPKKRYSARDAEFDNRKGLKVVKIAAVKEHAFRRHTL